jgi:hypothetical protein
MNRVLFACAMFFAFSTAVFAAQALPEECEKIKGTITCVDPVGNSEESGGQSQSVDTTSQGNLKNKQECSGPGASTSGC